MIDTQSPIIAVPSKKNAACSPSFMCCSGVIRLALANGEKKVGHFEALIYQANTPSLKLYAVNISASCLCTLQRAITSYYSSVFFVYAQFVHYIALRLNDEHNPI